MPIAAVPNYLGNDFSQASPGMRFGLLLPIWTTRKDQEAEVNRRAEARSREGDEARNLLRQGMDAAIRQLRQRQPRPLPGLWEKNDFAARDAWNNIKTLTKADQARMKALADRQSALARTIPADGLLRLDALSVAPFTTGLGNEHPLENGFVFLNPYGLPYLPGSGVKGVLRQAARELASGDWGDTHGWLEDENKAYLVQIDRKPVLLSMSDALFGKESQDGATDHVRGALFFWDVIPQIEGDSLLVEIMTPHQSHYCQWKKDQRGDEIPVSPHDSGQPTPISFLTVPPKSRFVFHVQCDLTHLRRLAPQLAEKGRWKDLLTAAFDHAFTWLGFGAKTAVGYGAMASQVVPGVPTSPQGTPRPHTLPREPTTVRWSGITLRLNPGNGELTASGSQGTARAASAEADKLLAALPGALQDQLKKKKELKGLDIEVKKLGNAWVILALMIEG